jgi:hypothetical protein
MFSIYIDDSGTSPEHKLTIACGIIFPTKRLPALEGEWNNFLQKEEITGFHSSECLARNPHSDFANWDDDRVKRVFRRIQQITFRYSIKAFCILIYKKDYDEVVPKDMFFRIGESYYTWAVSSVLGLAYDWAVERSVSIDYVFDTADKKVKREIEDALTIAETLYPGNFTGHYSFGKRRGVPGLQAVDLLAWTCFQQGRRARMKQSIHSFAQESWDVYKSRNDGDWCIVQSLSRKGLEDWVKKKYLSPEDIRIKQFKEKLQEARKTKAKKGRSTARC